MSFTERTQFCLFFWLFIFEFSNWILSLPSQTHFQLQHSLRLQFNHCFFFLSYPLFGIPYDWFWVSDYFLVGFLKLSYSFRWPSSLSSPCTEFSVCFPAFAIHGVASGLFCILSYPRDLLCNSHAKRSSPMCWDTIPGAPELCLRLQGLFSSQGVAATACYEFGRFPKATIHPISFSVFSAGREHYIPFLALPPIPDIISLGCLSLFI